MREIKFRAWEPDTEKMVDVFGINPMVQKVYLSHQQLFGTAGDDLLLSYKPDEEYSYVRLMQYTGLKDKNDVEIYEGDIVKILYTDWPSCGGCHNSPQEHMDALALTRVVIWSVQGFYVSHKPDGYAESIEPGTHGFVEVIGNIYENPDLLEAN